MVNDVVLAFIADNEDNVDNGDRTVYYARYMSHVCLVEDLQCIGLENLTILINAENESYRYHSILV